VQIGLAEWLKWYLLSKCKALSSTSSAAKLKKKRLLKRNNFGIRQTWGMM
jgi:hypothetical protein